MKTMLRTDVRLQSYGAPGLHLATSYQSYDSSNQVASCVGAMSPPMFAGSFWAA